MSKLVDSEFGFYIDGIFYPGQIYKDNTVNLVSGTELIDNGLGFLNESEIIDSIQAIIKLKENLLSVLPPRVLQTHSTIDSNIPTIPNKGYFMYQNLLFYNLAIFTGIVLQVESGYYGNYYNNGKFQSGVNGLTTISGNTYFLVNGSMNYSTGYAATNYKDQINYLYAIGGQLYKPNNSTSRFYYDNNRGIVLSPSSTKPNQSQVLLFNPDSSTNYDYVFDYNYLGSTVLFYGKNGGYAYNGFYSNLLYVNGLVFTGTYTNDLFYLNGTLYTGVYKNIYYLNGTVQNKGNILFSGYSSLTNSGFYDVYSFEKSESYTFTITGGYKFIYFCLVGGGGGGGGGNNNGNSGGGGGGGGGIFYNSTTPQIFPSGTYTITVGSGGVGGSVGAVGGTVEKPIYYLGTSGSNGGSSSIIGSGINISTLGGNGGGFPTGNGGTNPGYGGASINYGSNSSINSSGGTYELSGKGGDGYGYTPYPLATIGSIINIPSFNSLVSNGGGGGQPSNSGTAGNRTAGENGGGATNTNGGNSNYYGGGGGACTADCRNASLKGLVGGNGATGAVWVWF